MIGDVKDAIAVAHNFIVVDYRGPLGEFGSFRAIKVTYNDGEKVWTVICDFNKRGTRYRAKVAVDATTEKIKSYELIEGIEEK